MPVVRVVSVGLALVPEESLQLDPLQRVDHGVPQVRVAVLPPDTELFALKWIDFVRGQKIFVLCG